MRRHRRASVAFAIAIVGAGCPGATSSLEPLPPGGHHVLFVGNSLTYVNDLPATVAAIGASAGDTIRVAMEAGPGLALIDHLTGSSSAVQRIAQGRWEFVILSQGPTPSGLCRDSLVLWTQLFDTRIRAVGGRTALFMTWPPSAQAGIFDDVRLSFQYAAVAVNGVFMPAGEAWRSALRVDSSLVLYGADQFHPSAIGTFLAALEIYERVTGHDARNLPLQAFSGGQPITLPAATIQLLHNAAHDANTRFPATPMLDPLIPSTIPVGHC